MKRCTKLFRLFCLISLGGIMGGVLLRGVNDAGALDYQSNVGVGFTFNPSLNVTLSNEGLVINGLAPGTVARDSNIIDVNVSTNVAHGYNLYATVGNSGNATQNLVNGDYSFTPLSASVADLANFGKNEWGYSYSIDNGTNWINGDYHSATAGYGGLPLYTATGVKLAGSNDNVGSSVQFKIAAKAGATQASGEYKNVVNFAVVANVIPATLYDAFSVSGAEMVNGYYKMQDMTSSICNAAEGESWLQLVDARDNKLYWVAKLADGHCWMTQNLDLDLISDTTASGYVALTSDNTNLSTDASVYGTNSIYADGYTVTTDTTTGDITRVTWVPERATYRSAAAPGSNNWANNDDTSATGSGNYNPYSWDRLLTDDGGVVYPDGTVTQAVAGNHAMAGNYYNWSAAVASNNTYDASGSQKNSICPKGWRLPVNGEYGTLYNTYKTSSHNYKAYGLMDDPLWFVRSGRVNGSGRLEYSDIGGWFWSSTVSSSTNSYFLFFNYYDVHPASNDNRFYGSSVRCIAE